MPRSLQIGGVLLLALTPGLIAQKGEARRQRESPPARVTAPKGPRGGARIANPGLVAQQLMQMTPEERERALEKLPPQRQAQLRERLEKFDSLPPQQRERMIRQYQMLSSLPPEKQNLVRRQIQAFNHLPDDRRRQLGPELQRLRRMPENERQARIASDDFKTKYTPEEQQMLSDISQNMPLPGR